MPAANPREMSGPTDITGGLRVTELFEARAPKIHGDGRTDGVVEFGERKRKRTIIVKVILVLKQALHSG